MSRETSPSPRLAAILIPAGFHAAFSGSIGTPEEKADVLSMSRGTAVIVLVIYFAFMVFQLWSHAHLFVDSGTDGPANRPRRMGKHTMFRESKSVQRANAAAGLPVKGAAVAAPAYPVAGGDGLEAAETGSDTIYETEEEVEEEEKPTINVWSTVVLLLVVTVLVGVTAEW
jgi:Ca2+:H+ antiporter